MWTTLAIIHLLAFQPFQFREKKEYSEGKFIQPTLKECCRSTAIYKTSNPMLKLINMHNWRHPVILWPGLRKLFCGTLIILVRTPSYKYCQHCSLPSTKWKSGVWENNCEGWGHSRMNFFTSAGLCTIQSESLSQTESRTVSKKNPTVVTAQILPGNSFKRALIFQMLPDINNLGTALWKFDLLCGATMWYVYCLNISESATRSTLGLAGWCDSKHESLPWLAGVDVG